MSPLIDFKKNIFVVRDCPLAEREPFRKAGFKWHGDYKCLFTESAQVAARLGHYANEIASKKIENAFIKVNPWTGDVLFPQNLTPYPFQIDAAKFALSRNRCYLGLDPGLGKTIVAAMVMSSSDKSAPVVYICPPGLAYNAKEKLQRWATYEPIILIWPDVSPFATPSILILPDSMLTRPEVVTYLKDQKPDRLFVDEAHRFKNPEAKRTKALFKLTNLFPHVVLMSGTPMPNRPIELFSVLSKFAPETIDFMNETQFGMQYCDGFFDGYGYNFKGEKNIKVLASRVKEKFMLRLRKKDVLKDMPPKTEELVFIGDGPPYMSQIEKELLARFSPDTPEKMGMGEMARYRHNLGVEKVPIALKFIRDSLEGTDESIIIFAEHLDVIEILKKELAKFHPVVITGEVDKNIRQDLIRSFQLDPLKRIVIGNIKACGIGFDITKATRAVFVEFSWVPGDNDQAVDRIHRIGQEHSVHVQYLVFKNSFDRIVMETNLRKRKSINQM